MEETQTMEKTKMSLASLIVGIVGLILQLLGCVASFIYLGGGIILLLLLAFSGGGIYNDGIGMFYGSIIFIIIDIIIATIMGIVAIVMGVLCKKRGDKGKKHIRWYSLWKYHNYDSNWIYIYNRNGCCKYNSWLIRKFKCDIGLQMCQR